MYILIKDEIVSVQYFIDAMHRALPDSVILDTRDSEGYAEDIARLDSKIDNTTVVISFNFAGLLTNVGDSDDIYWEVKGVTFYTLLMDHPANFLSVLGIHFPSLYIVPCDDQHKRFIERYMPWHKGQIIFLPHGGQERDLYSNEEREIDVLFIGTLDGKTKAYPMIDFLPDSGSQFWEFVCDLFIRNPYMEADIAVDAYCMAYALVLDDEKKLFLCSLATMYADRSTLHGQKVALVQALAHRGITVEVHGTLWKEQADLFPDNVHIGEFLTMDESVVMCGHSKIVLNLHPHFSYGAHDRVFNAMLNGAVCVSNKSRYLEDRFEDGKDIIYIDFDDIERTVDYIEQILFDDKLRLSIKENAYQKVTHDHWSDRVKQLIEKTLTVKEE